MQRRRSYPVRDKIMRRYDQELLGARLWCTTQQEGLWIQGVNVIVPQRRIFVCASKLALDESLSHQHMRAVYHRGRSPSASTSESHGGGRDHVNDQELLGAPLRIIEAAGVLDCFSAHIRLRELDKSKDKAESTDRERRDEDTSQRILGLWAWQHHGTAEAGLPWSHRSLALVEGEDGRKRGRGGGECKDKLQVPRQGGRTKAKELHKTGVDGLLIKIAKSGGLRVDA
ncbi:hypothetical protein BHE74_00033262, partial [Ensete ventricosum]